MHGSESGAVSARQQTTGVCVEAGSTAPRFVWARAAIQAVWERVPAAGGTGGDVAGVAFGRIGWGTDSRTVVEIGAVDMFDYGRESSWGNRSRAGKVGRICARARRHGLLPVGWVRSAGPGPAELSAVDLDLAERFFPEEYHGFVLLRREGPEAVTGTLFV